MRNKFKSSYLLSLVIPGLIVFLCTFIFSCSKNPPDDYLTGGGGVIGNGIQVSGALTNENAPAASALVYMYPYNANPKEVLPTSTVADVNGRYTFKYTSPGRYNILGKDPISGNSVLLRDLVFTEEHLNYELVSSSLFPPKTIQISLRSLNFENNDYIYLPGTNIYTVLDNINSSDSLIVLENVPINFYTEVLLSTIDTSLNLIKDSLVFITEDTLVIGFIPLPGDSGGNNIDTIPQDSTPAVDSTIQLPGFKTLYLNTGPTGANLSNDIYDFPLLIKLNGHNFYFDSADENNFFITKFNGEVIPTEIDSWDTVNQTASIWALIDTVRAQDSLQKFLVYPNNPNLIKSTQPVFSNQVYDAVWHMGNSLDGNQVGVLTDATPNQYHMTAYGNMNQSNVVEGMIGKAMNLDGVNDHFELGSSSSILVNAPHVSVSTWVKPNTDRLQITSDSMRTELDILTIGTVDHAVAHDSRLELSIHRGDKVSLLGRAPDDMGNAWLSTNTQTVETNTWYHITAVIDYAKDSVLIYLNGQLAAEATRNYQDTLTTNQNPGNVAIGNEDVNIMHPFHGIIDEIRISRNIPTEDWVRLEYLTQLDGTNLILIE